MGEYSTYQLETAERNDGFFGGMPRLLRLTVLVRRFIDGVPVFVVHFSEFEVLHENEVSDADLGPARVVRRSGVSQAHIALMFLSIADLDYYEVLWESRVCTHIDLLYDVRFRKRLS